MKIFSSLSNLLQGQRDSRGIDTERFLGWLRDPLSHPDIERMDARELGDLPLGRGFRPALPVPGEGSCRA
ncbi:hypothetical protein [Aminobacter carboxidus]|uniref:Uncharacterized protein n=1 Tax=Aminobacter carboxidus TaxID=376165 RepID=A0A8E1WGG2_9HYPH|nr:MULTISPECIES: hypothetical protein [Aminobacter carboxidus group]MBB6467081.1 hypothetical protein [Aminobacter lissarensis]MBE1202873.1 hypothetical protein [Aminobacter carboxidus]